MGLGRRLTGVAVVALACVPIAGGAAGAQLLAESRVERSRAALSERLGTAAVAFNRSVSAALQLVEAELAAGASVTDVRAAAGPAVRAVATLDAEGRITGPEDRSAGDTGPGIATLVRDEVALQTLSTAGDRAAPRVAVIPTAGETALLGVVPRYDPVRPAASTAARREALQGFLVALIDVERLARASVGSVIHEGDAVQVRAGGEVVFRAGASEASTDDVSIPLALPGARWTVDAHLDESGGWAEGLIAVGLGISALGLVVAVRRRRELDRAAAASEARADAAALVTEVGMILQRSLDLADVLPALATALTDNLQLDGLVVLLASDEGGLVSSFSAGDRRGVLPGRAADVPPLPSEVAAGDDVVVPLDRGGRAVGAVWMAPRFGLTRAQVVTTSVVAELIGSAIANARTLQREQAVSRRLVEVDQLKNDFLGTVSHELRTPVTAIDGFGSILEERWDAMDEGQRRELVVRIARNARSLRTMLEGLLDFARLERRSIHLERTEVDLGQLVHTVLEQTSSLLDQRHLELDVEPGLWVWSDPQGIERILANLVTNSAKFSPPDTTISVGVRAAGAWVVLTVADQGPGIPREERARIFSRFYRGPGDAALRTRGAGVGLAVVKELVDRLGATIAVTDAPGGGARFVVSFPAAVPATTGATG